MGFIEALDKRTELLNMIKRQAERDIKKVPEGQLHCKKVDKVLRFYYRRTALDTNGTYLSSEGKQGELIQKLAQKKYAEMMLNAAEGELKYIDRCRRIITQLSSRAKVEDVVDKLKPPLQTMTMHYIETDEEFARNWQNEPYEYYDFKEFNKVHSTLLGEKVRSKSEQIIANILFHLGIPYKYECPLRSGFRKLHPDFTILDVRRRKVIYWEHFGKADDENYATNAITKLAAYSSMCVDVGGDLIVTCETSGAPLDTDYVMSILSDRGLIPDRKAA